jgi:hydroxyacylglutathione hydrolase
VHAAGQSLSYPLHLSADHPDAPVLLRRFYDSMLAQASYLVGCQRTGEAVVVDPNRDIAQYLDAAAAEGVRVTQVTETHIHADFVSGARSLARRAGARLLLSAEGGAGWRYRFAEGDDARLLADGDRIEVGAVRLDVLHTPGHTPEHLAFLVTDTAATDRPLGALTGDFLFVGDVGRPDLLERAAGERGTMDAAARALFRSLRRFVVLPDYLQIWPGHGAGSACGKALGAVPQSTLGYEMIVNWALSIDDEEEFARRVLEGQPPPPPYFARMKRINRDDPPTTAPAVPPMLPPADVARALAAGALVLDVRPRAAFAAGHVPGSLHIPHGRSLVTWAGWLTPYDRDLLLLAPSAQVAADAARALARIGIDRVRGAVDEEALAVWRETRGSLATTERATTDTAQQLVAGGAAVLDVRARDEYAEGHLPGATNIPLGELAARIGELPRGRPLVVHCHGGTRSAIAASVLESAGVEGVVDLDSGYGAWEREGRPVEREQAPARGEP